MYANTEQISYRSDISWYYIPSWKPDKTVNYINNLEKISGAPEGWVSHAQCKAHVISIIAKSPLKEQYPLKDHPLLRKH